MVLVAGLIDKSMLVEVELEARVGTADGADSARHARTQDLRTAWATEK